MRARAFHILEPRGTVDMLIIFLEERSEGSPPLLDSSKVSLTNICAALCVYVCILHICLLTQSTWCIIFTPAGRYFLYSFSCFPLSFILNSWQDVKNRIAPFLGKWKGRSVTKRSGVYGSTIAEADTVVLHEIDDNGLLIQVFYILITRAIA